MKLSVSYFEWNTREGNVRMRGVIRNMTERRMKYVYLEFLMKNGVGDIIQNTINSNSSILVEIVGPIEPSDQEGKNFHEVTSFYAKNAVSIALVQAIVVYMDGNKRNNSGQRN